MRYDELWERGLERLRSVGMDRYLDLGAETRSQNRLNRDFMDSIAFQMRILGSKPADPTATLFGCTLSSPLVGAAVCESRVLEALGPWDPHYLELIASGLADAGSLMSTGDVEPEMLSRIVDCGAPVFHVIKPFDDDERIFDQLRLAEALGCVAVGMDVDCSFGEKAWDEVPGPAYLTHKSLDQMSSYIDSTTLPFMIKGVLSVEDAKAAARLGAAGVVVSMHGGEAIDYTVPVLKVLPAIREAAPDLIVLVDSGFRRGTDALKALALGADGVGFVTVLLVACAAAGSDGVRMMMEILHEELQRTMSYAGAANVREVDTMILFGNEQK